MDVRCRMSSFNEGRRVAFAAVLACFLFLGAVKVLAKDGKDSDLLRYKRLLYLFNLEDPKKVKPITKTIERGGRYQLSALIGPKLEAVKFVYRHPLELKLPSNAESFRARKLEKGIGVEMNGDTLGQRFRFPAWKHLSLDSYVYPYYYLNYRGNKPFDFSLSFFVDIDNDDAIDFLAYVGREPEKIPRGLKSVAIEGTNELKGDQGRFIINLYDQFRRKFPERISFIVREVQLEFVSTEQEPQSYIISGTGFYQEETRNVSFIKKRSDDAARKYAPYEDLQDKTVVVESGWRQKLLEKVVGAGGDNLQAINNLEVDVGASKTSNEATELAMKILDPNSGEASIDISRSISINVSRYPYFMAGFSSPVQGLMDVSAQFRFSNQNVLKVKIGSDTPLNVREEYRQRFGNEGHLELISLGIQVEGRRDLLPKEKGGQVIFGLGQFEFYNLVFTDPLGLMEKTEGAGRLMQTPLFEMSEKKYYLKQLTREDVNRILTKKEGVSFGGLAFSSGERVLLTPFKNDFLEVKSVFLTEEVTNEGKDPKIVFRRINPTRYVADVVAEGPFWLMLNENFHVGWRAYAVKGNNPGLGSEKSALQFSLKAAGKLIPLKEHTVLNAYANGWWVPVDKIFNHKKPYKFRVIMEFHPQRLFEVGLIVSALAFLAMVSYLALSAIKGVKKG